MAMQEDGGQGMRKKRKTGLVLLAVIAMLAGSGCSRRMDSKNGLEGGRQVEA